jgi:hypothetical protein
MNANTTRALIIVSVVVVLGIIGYVMFAPSGTQTPPSATSEAAQPAPPSKTQ